MVSGIEISDWQSWLAGTAIFAIVNVVLKPIAMLASCCLIAATFGFFVLFVNTALLGFTAWVAGQLELNFVVEGFWSAFFGALVISAVSLIETLVIRKLRRVSEREQ